MNNTDSHQKIYGVLGFPVKHSLSPLMHNAAFRELKINAEYLLFEKPAEDLGQFLRSLAQQGIYGLNVTVPYKEVAVKYLQWESPEVRFTGASNTLVVKENGFLEGWNTDGAGFTRHLTKDLNFDPSAKVVVMLGSGGAAKAVASQLAKKGAKSITIYDPAMEKSIKLSKKISLEFPSCQAKAVDSIDELDIKGAELLINASPIGMKKSDPCLISQDRLHSGLLVYDLIYNPAETALLKLAREKGALTSNGLGMLLYQGALSFQHFTGKPAPVEVMRKALIEGVNKL